MDSGAQVAGWTDERVETLKKLWMEGLSASQIAGQLGQGVTRNAVIGKVHRLKLSARAKPTNTAQRARPARPVRRRAVRPAHGSSSEQSSMGTASAAAAATKIRPAMSRPQSIGATALAAQSRNGKPGLCRPHGGRAVRSRRQAPEPAAAERKHLQMADRRPAHQGILLLRRP